MKNTFKKSLSVTIAVMMLCTLALCGITANATEPVANGTCGEDVNWSLDDAGTLSITGTGKIDVSDDEGTIHVEEIPWYAYRKDILKVTIAEGITSIGINAFESCVNLSEISISSTVTEIEENAFDFCESLETIVIPDSVTQIGQSAFLGCCGLKSITLPEGINTVSPYIFYLCTALEEITIPDSVELIGEMAFYGCVSLKTVNIGSGLKTISEAAFMLCIAEGDDLNDYREYYESSPTDDECIDVFDIPLKGLYDILNVTDIGVTAVNYNGYEEDWADVQVADGNEDFTAADFTFITERTATDEASGVEFTYDSDVFGKDLAVTVSETTDEGVFALIDEKTGAEKVKAYDFSFTGENAFPEGGKLTIRVPLPEGFSADDVKVYYVNPETGAFEDMNAVVEDGFLVFETTHFSTYAVIDESTIPEPEPEPEPEEQSFFAKVIAFFRNIIETIKGWFAGLIK